MTSWNIAVSHWFKHQFFEVLHCSKKISSESSYADLFSCFFSSRCNVPGFNLHPGKGPRLCNKNKPSTWSTNSLSQFHSLGLHQVAHLTALSENRIPFPRRSYLILSEVIRQEADHPAEQCKARERFPPASRVASLNAWLLDHLGSSNSKKLTPIWSPETAQITPRKLTWQRKIPIFNRVHTSSFMVVLQPVVLVFKGKKLVKKTFREIWGKNTFSGDLFNSWPLKFSPIVQVGRHQNFCLWIWVTYCKNPKKGHVENCQGDELSRLFMLIWWRQSIRNCKTPRMIRTFSKYLRKKRCLEDNRTDLQIFKHIMYKY